MVNNMDPATMMAIVSAITTAAGGLTGSKGETGSTYSKPQKQGINDILDSIRGMKGGAMDITQNQGYGQGLDWLMSMFNDPEFFNSFEAPLQRQFQEQTVPDLANRFASMGSGGALGSTGFRNQLAREGSNLSTNIAALRGNMMQQAVPQLLQYAQQPFSNLMSLYQQALQPTENTYQPASTGFFGGVAPSITSAAAQMYANKMGNPGQQDGFQSQPMSRMYPGQSPSTY